MSDDRKADSERQTREKRQDTDAEKARTEQNKTNNQTWNNSGLLRDIQSRQCEMLEKMGEIKVSIDDIRKHTATMNEELGACKDDIAVTKADIKDLKSKIILKIGWKQIGLIIGGTSGLIGIVFTLIKAFVFHQL